MILEQVAPGTQPSDSKVLYGAGMRREKLRGNMIVHYKVQIPTTLSKEQTDLIRQFGKDEHLRPVESQIAESFDQLLRMFRLRK